MAKNCVGIDIGERNMKMAVCSNGRVRRLVVQELPDNLVRDGKIVSLEEAAAFIKKTAKSAKIKTRNCGVIIPAALAFTSTLTLPAMSAEHLSLNLPYEFSDFIPQEKDKYFYDYAVLDTILNEAGVPSEIELIASSTLKETIQEYSLIFKRAGFKLKTAIPDELAYMNIIRNYVENGGSANAGYCLIDLGHTATRLFIFKGTKHQATRVVEYGIAMLDAAISEALGVDEHIARTHKQANTNNILDSDSCKKVYSNISIEVMRAINFYRFSAQDNNLDEVYIMGSGAKIPGIAKQLAADLDMPVRSIEKLFQDFERSDDVVFCPAAIGVALQ